MFFWFTATVEYTLPVLTLLLCLAFVVETVSRLRSNWQLAIAAIAVLALGFINAGFSEMYLVFQLAFLAMLVVCVCLFADGPKRSTYIVLAAAAFVGTLVSLPVQLSRARYCKSHCADRES